MAKIVFLLVLLCISASFAKKKKDEEKPDWAKKDIRDFSDADMERLFDQWEEDEEPLPEDELPEHLRKPPSVDFTKLDMSNPESVLQATKKGQTLMMFVSVANKPSRARTEEITKIWQTSLWSNHIQVERYLVDDDRAIFMFKDGAQAWTAKEFLLEQEELKEVQLESQTYPGKKPDIKVILNQFINGVGVKGDVLSLRPTQAYRDYLMPGLAVYASPENLVKYKSVENEPKAENSYSSPYVRRTLGRFSKLVLQITMNKLQPWTLEPWHISASFRKSGFIVPEYAIEMPPVQIKGPDLSLQDKEFLITVTINKTEKAKVRCRIHHWATGLDRLPWEEFHWKQPKEALIPDQAAELENMPLPQ